MTHPHHLHATAALWSLRAAWPELTHARAMAYAAAREDDDGGTIQAWRPTTGRGGGPRGLDDALLRGGALAAGTRYIEVERRVRQAIEWLAGQLLGEAYDPAGGALVQLLDVVPQLTPEVAERLARHVADADSAVRSALAIPGDHQPLHLACPECGTAVAMRTSAPAGQRAIVCGAGHIWPEADGLEVLRDGTATAAQLETALAALGLPVTAAAIRGHRHRGRLWPEARVPAEHEPDEGPRYRLGDVVRVIADALRRAQGLAA